MDHTRESTYSLFDDLHVEDTGASFPTGEPTKSHYIPSSERTCCANKDCGSIFSLTTRPHHCRRCGEVFCRACLQFRRKLNILAQFDADGLQCRVCFGCFHDNRYTCTASVTCPTRSHTQDFIHVRQLCRDEMSGLICDLTLERRKNSIVVPVVWRDEFHIDVEKECRRLLSGFLEAVGATETEPRRTWRELMSAMAVKVPGWQKSPYWKLEKERSRCRECQGRLGFRRKLRFCRVCGLALCKACSHEELLLYYKDDAESETDRGAKLAVIHVHGSPDVEPDISLMLYVCQECKAEISRRQIDDPDWFVEKPKVPDVMSHIVALDDCFRNIQESITEESDKLEEVFNMAESGDSSSSTTGVLSSLAKHIPFVTHDRKLQTDDHNNSFTSSEMDLREEVQMLLYEDQNLDVDHADMLKATKKLGVTFASYEILFKKLRSLKTQLKSQSGAMSTVLRNYTKSKYDFYLAKKQRYLQLMRHIGETS